MLAPCALGGVLDDFTVPQLRARAIAGAANNQLAHEAIAELLAERGILWVPDFVANAGGVVNIAVELEPAGYDEARAETRVRAIADTVRTVLDHAEATGSTPLAAANEIAHRRVAEALAGAARQRQLRLGKELGRPAAVHFVPHARRTRRRGTKRTVEVPNVPRTARDGVRGTKCTPSRPTQRS